MTETIMYLVGSDAQFSCFRFGYLGYMRVCLLSKL